MNDETIICAPKRSSIRNGVINIYDVTERSHKEHRPLTDHEWDVIKVNCLRMVECCGLFQSIEEIKKAMKEIITERDLL